MCTLLLRFAPGGPWPVLAGAVRDEFADRPWDPPAHHWDGPHARLIGGRDRSAGGTWLAVDPGPGRPALAALLNGARLPPPEAGARPTRGLLALRALTEGGPRDAASVAGYDGFHLVLATLERVDIWSWDGEVLVQRRLPPGDHIVVNGGPDTDADPLVPHFTPLLARAATPDPRAGVEPAAAWGSWLDLMAGDGLDPSDPRALVVRREVEGRTYASTSSSLVALSASGVRYDFSGAPGDGASWSEVTAAASAAS